MARALARAINDNEGTATNKEGPSKIYNARTNHVITIIISIRFRHQINKQQEHIHFSRCAPYHLRDSDDGVGHTSPWSKYPNHTSRLGTLESAQVTNIYIFLLQIIKMEEFNRLLRRRLRKHHLFVYQDNVNSERKHIILSFPL